MASVQSNQQLCRDLKAASHAIAQAAHDLFRTAKQYNEAEMKEATLKIEKLHRLADRLIAHADEVKAGKIVRITEMGSWPGGDI
jgi:hypothetical protein